jgi:D-inositol-3-phosphate glycosyltransferase
VEAETLQYSRRPVTERAPVVVRGDLSAATMRAFDHLVTAERELVHAADVVLAVSEFAATDIATAYRIPRPRVVANGVEGARFCPGSPSPPTGGRRVMLATDTTVTAGSRMPPAISGIIPAAA